MCRLVWSKEDVGFRIDVFKDKNIINWLDDEFVYIEWNCMVLLESLGLSKL